MSLSLSNLLIELGYEKLLTMDDVIKTIDAYREAHDGENPKLNSGYIEQGPLTGMMTWVRLNDALRRDGGYGLGKDPAWQVLNKKIGEGKVTLSKILVELGYKKNWTMKEVVETIDAYRDANSEKNPTADSGKIEHGPLAGKTTWAGLNSALQKGGLGLKEDPEWQAFDVKLTTERASLATLLVELEYKDAPLALNMGIIIETVDAYRATHNGENPTLNTGDIEQGPLAGLTKWINIDDALKDGGSGLRDDPAWQNLQEKLGSKKLSLHVLLIELGYKSQPLILTMDLVVETIDEHCAANEGGNPAQTSGKIKHGPLAGLMTWSALDANLRLGNKGLSKDPQWQALDQKLGSKKVSLPELLIDLERKDATTKLTLDLIIETIGVCHTASSGANLRYYGAITHGPLAGEISWAKLRSALNNGRYGLQYDPAWQALNAEVGEGNDTFSKILADLGYEYVPSTLTVNAIVESINEYREANNGQNPINTSGEIVHGPLARTGNWNRVSTALKTGIHGLNEDPAWHELQNTLGAGKVSLHTLLIELGYKRNWTIKHVLETIDAYREANNGENPIQNSSEIECGPLKGMISWAGLMEAVKNGRNGLAQDPEWQALKNKLGKENIAFSDFLIEYGYKSPSSIWTIDKVVESIDQYRANHKNRNPTQYSEEIEYGPLAGAGTWSGVNQALKVGRNGFGDDPKWQTLNAKVGDGNLTLVQLLVELEYKDTPLQLTMGDIIATIDAYRETHDGENPTQISGEIEHGFLKGKITWGGLDGVLRNGSSGLKDDPEWQAMDKKYGGKFSLAKLKREYTGSPSTPDCQNDLPAPGEP